MDEIQLNEIVETLRQTSLMGRFDPATLSSLLKQSEVLTPDGISRITFSYAPPGFGWALIAAAAAGMVTFSGFALGLRRMRRQNFADAVTPLA